MYVYNISFAFFNNLLHKKIIMYIKKATAQTSPIQPNPAQILVFVSLERTYPSNLLQGL